MKRLAHAKRRDANEPEIVAALRDAGADVELLDGPVDLLVGHWGTNYLMEVKTKTGKLKATQEKFTKNWKGATVHVVRTVNDALEVLGLIAR